MRLIVSLLILFTLYPLSTYSQTTDLGKLLLKDVPGNYMGQRADNSKDKSGSGILKISEGAYIGDLNRNQYNGKGMIICGDKGKISNAPDAYIYVGGFIKGKKQGKGTCYAPNGDILYQGRFENDKPTDAYPTPEPDILRYFSIMEIPEGYYIGELKAGTPDGFGACVQQDGAIWIGNSLDGTRNGMSIFLYGPSEWLTVNYRNNECKEISSSSEYQQRNHIIKSVNKQMWSEFWDGMSDVADGLMKIGSEFVSSRQKAESDTNEMGIDDEAGSGKNGKSKNRSANSKNKGNDCGTAWMSDSNAYSGFESTIIKGGLSLSEIEDIQRKMKRIRTKWEARGCHFTKSPYE